MKKKYKILDLLLVLVILLVVSATALFSYFFIRNKINEFKETISRRLSAVLKKKVTIAEMTPIFYNGIRLSGLQITDEKTGKITADIRHLKIFIKIKDILLGKVSLDRSISRLTLDGFVLNISRDDIRSLSLSGRQGGEDREGYSFTLTFLEGRIRWQDPQNGLAFHIRHRYSRLDLEDRTFQTELELEGDRMFMFGSRRLRIPVEAAGEWGREIKITGAFHDITLGEMSLDKDIPFELKTENQKRNLFCSFTGGTRGINGSFSIRNDAYQFKAGMKDFSLFGIYRIKGNLKYAQQAKGMRYSVDLSSLKGRKLIVHLSGDQNQTELKNLAVSLGKNQYITGKGYRKNKDHNFSFKCQGLSLMGFNLKGKLMLEGRDDKNFIRLDDYYFNDFRIRSYLGEWGLADSRLFLRTLQCSENFYVSLVRDRRDGIIRSSVLFNDFILSSLFQFAGKTPGQEGKITGSLNFSIRDRIRMLENDLKITLSENSWIDSCIISSKLDHGLLTGSCRVFMNNQEEMILRVFSTDLKKANGEVIHSGVKEKFTLETRPSGKGFRAVFRLEDYLGLNLQFRDSEHFTVRTEIEKKTGRGKIRLKGTLERSSAEWMVQGACSLFYDRHNLIFSFCKKKQSIILDDIMLRLFNRELKGKGVCDLAKKRIHVELPGILIKGDFLNNRVNLYAFFNKFSSLSPFEGAFMNLNGFINISGPPDDLRIYADLNPYGFRFKNLLLPNLYTIFIYNKRKISFKKFNAEYLNGSLSCDVKNFYVKEGGLFTDGVLRIQNLHYRNDRITGKLYYKVAMAPPERIRIKILELFYNDMVLEDITADLLLEKGRISVRRESDNGLEGFLSTSHETNHAHLSFRYGDNSLDWSGYSYAHTLNYRLDIRNLELEEIAPAWKGIKDADGRIKGWLHISGLDTDPLLNGRLAGDNIRIRLPSLFKKIDDVNFQCTLDKNNLIIDQCTGTIGSGSFSLLGKVLLRKMEPDNYDLIFRTTGENGIYLEKSENDIMGNVRASLVIKGNNEELGIAGNIILDKFDFTWPIEGYPEGGGGSPSLKLNLNCDIIAGEKVVFYQDSNNLDIKVKEGGKFHINGDINGKHKVTGKMEAEQGTIEYFGTTFTIVYATVSFAPYYFENVPWISARAEADVKGIEDEDVLITMRVEGRAYNDLTPLLSSSPALTQREIFLLLNDSTYYVSDNLKNKDAQQKEINELIKRGFIQIFDATSRTRLLTPLERRTKRILGLDLLKIRTSLVKNLLEPRLYKVQENNAKIYNPLADTRLTVGKYLTDSVLFKYSVILKENPYITRLDYEHQFGVEWKIMKSLNFEWMYLPLYYEDYSIPMTEQKYRLEWKKTF